MKIRQRLGTWVLAALAALAASGPGGPARAQDTTVIELPDAGGGAGLPVTISVSDEGLPPVDNAPIPLGPLPPARPDMLTVEIPSDVTTPGTTVSVGGPLAGDRIRCANWIYAGSKSSVCFSSKFLSSVTARTNIEVDDAFTPVKLASDTVFEHPFAIMTGEGTFTLREEERWNLRSYLERGGFLLASAGCSSAEWARAFRLEIKRVLPESDLHKIQMDHPLFRTVFEVASIALKNGGTTLLEGIELNGRLVLVYSSEGLNDTSNVKGCCCCGGNEVRNSHDINVNILAYAIMH